MLVQGELSRIPLELYLPCISCEAITSSKIHFAPAGEHKKECVIYLKRNNYKEKDWHLAPLKKTRPNI